MKLIHAGDLHVWRHGILFSDAFAIKRWLGAANLLLHRASLFPPELRNVALEAIEAEKPDAVIFTGDFSQSSQRSEFQECARLFRPLQERLGDRLIALPGNHDVYTPGAVRKQWLETELPWVHTAPVDRVDLDGALTVVTVNHSRPFRLRSNGQVDPRTQERLRATLEECRREGRVVLLAGHYPYVTPPEHPETPDHRLLGEEAFSELVQEFSPPVYLHGHKHVRWALRSSHTPSTLCLNCGSLGMSSDQQEKQAGFLSWDQEEDGTVRNLTAHRFTGQGELRQEPLSVYKTP
jgi:3',5'-cyclic AMP phosphodiesterase CpdA